MDQTTRLVARRDPSAGAPAIDEPNDAELALAARADREAFGLLYRRHRLAVYRYLRARTRTDDEAAELTAVTFERALGAIERYQATGGGFLAWVLRIARNAAIDAGRRAACVALGADVPDGRDHASPESTVLAGEARRALVAAIAGLPEIQREMIVLRYGSGLTARQIGELLGKTEAAAQKSLSRALATIRERYRDDV